MQVSVDAALCEAHALCTGVAPEVFHLDDEDVLHVVQEHPSPDLRPALEKAVLRCPKQAITLRD